MVPEIRRGGGQQVGIFALERQVARSKDRRAKLAADRLWVAVTVMRTLCHGGVLSNDEARRAWRRTATQEGCTSFFGSTIRSKSAALTKPSCSAASRSVRSLCMAWCAIFAALS